MFLSHLNKSSSLIEVLDLLTYFFLLTGYHVFVRIKSANLNKNDCTATSSTHTLCCFLLLISFLICTFVKSLRYLLYSWDHCLNVTLSFSISFHNLGGIDPSSLPWTYALTSPTPPIYSSYPHLQKNGTSAAIDFRHSFTLNGRLREFVVSADGQVVFRGVGFSAQVERQTRDQIIRFVIKVGKYITYKTRLQ